MDWHSGVPMHETSKKVGLDSSMSPLTNDIARYTTEIQQKDNLNETSHTKASASTVNALHFETAMPHTNILIAKKMLISSSN